MILSDLTFLFRFFPLFFLFYLLSPPKGRNALLVVGSFLFYAYGSPLYGLIVLLLSVCATHGFALGVASFPAESKPRRLCLTFSLVYLFSQLLFFKYLPTVLPLLPAQFPWEVPADFLPLGISFYTFQAAAYLIDVYRGKAAPQRNLLVTVSYLAMFPHLTAGPILSYPPMVRELRAPTVRGWQIEVGLSLFIVGLCYKVLLANQLSSLWAALCSMGYETLPTPLAWMGAVGYSLQLYFDFHGYSLMAQGLGAMLGFSYPDNFNLPYLSRSVSEFWRRWHITLGSWFRDYVYIPLGGSRRGERCTARNLLLVWLLTGIWHGAGWTFPLWGLCLFLLIWLERLFLGKFLSQHRVFSHLYLLFVIPLTWMIFALDSLESVRLYFMRLFPFFSETVAQAPDLVLLYWGRYWPFLAAGVFFCLPYCRRFFQRYYRTLPFQILLFFLFWLSVFVLAKSGSNPFLYFQF